MMTKKIDEDGGDGNDKSMSVTINKTVLFIEPFLCARHCQVF